MRRLRRTCATLLDVFDYRTFVVAGGFVTLLLIGYLVFTSVERAEQAFTALDRQTELALDIREAQSRRIDLLERELAVLAESAGRNAAAVEALTAQLRALGADPIVAGTAVSPRPAASPRSAPQATAAPRRPRPATSPPPPPQPPRPPAASPRPTADPSAAPSPQPCLIRNPITGRCLA